MATTSALSVADLEHKLEQSFKGSNKTLVRFVSILPEIYDIYALINIDRGLEANWQDYVNIVMVQAGRDKPYVLGFDSAAWMTDINRRSSGGDGLLVAPIYRTGITPKQEGRFIFCEAERNLWAVDLFELKNRYAGRVLVNLISAESGWDSDGEIVTFEDPVDFERTMEQRNIIYRKLREAT